MQEMGEWFKGSFDVYMCSSACGFPSYGVDFQVMGWILDGESRYGFVVSNPKQKTRFCCLLDSAGNGIEAMVIFEEEKMSSVFEKNQNLLSFTCRERNQNLPPSYCFS